jgi:ribosomal protein S18 acetylase RimI-like enzyme
LKEIILREIDKSNIHHVNQCDGSFTVNSKLILNAENGKISYTVVELTPYTKRYQEDEADHGAYISNPDKTIFLAYINTELAGYIKIRKYWNTYAYIDDVAVDIKYRRQGVGQALMEGAIHWAQAKGSPGIMLETQSNNVPACKFYESCGFELHGFDTHLYKAINPYTDEIALYWYLIF